MTNHPWVACFPSPTPHDPTAHPVFFMSWAMYDVLPPGAAAMSSTRSLGCGCEKESERASERGRGHEEAKSKKLPRVSERRTGGQLHRE
jgi:hypothetical protein